LELMILSKTMSMTERKVTRRTVIAAVAVAVIARANASIATEMIMNAITAEDVDMETTKTFMEVPFQELCLKVILMSSTAHSARFMTPATWESMLMERLMTKMTISTHT